MINVALPKGRLGEKVYDMFERAGFDCPGFREKDRELVFENKEKNLFLRFTFSPHYLSGICKSFLSSAFFSYIFSSASARSAS